MTTLLRRRKELDDEYCWKKWMTPPYISLESVSKELEAQGKIGSHSKKRYTGTTIRVAAMRWCIDKENQEEARKDLEQKIASMDGKLINDDDWLLFLTEAGKFVYNARPKKFEQFVAQNGLQRFVK